MSFRARQLYRLAAAAMAARHRRASRSVLATMIYWDLALDPSGSAAYFDRSGYGNQVYFGGVKKAIIADTVYGDRGLILPKIIGNYASTGAPGMTLYGLEIEVEHRARTYPPTECALLSEYPNAAGQRALRLLWEGSGKLLLTLSQDGTAGSSAESSVAVTNPGTSRVRHKVTWRPSDGRVQFFESFDYGDTWAQVGSNKSIALASIFLSTAPICIGTWDGGAAGPYSGTIYRAIVRDGIDGNVLIDANPESVAQGTSTWNDAHGNTFTVNTAGSSTAEPTVDYTADTITYDGVDDYDEADDVAGLDVGATEGLTIAQAFVVPVAPAAEGVILGKKSGISTSGAGPQLTLNTSNQIVFRVSDGTNVATSTSLAQTAGAKVVAVGVLDRATRTATVFVNGVRADSGDASSVGSLANAVEFRANADGAGANFLGFTAKAKRAFKKYAFTDAEVRKLTLDMA